MSKDEKDMNVGDLIAPVQNEERKEENTNISTEDFASGTETKSAIYEQSAYSERLRVYDEDNQVSFGDFSDSAFGSSVGQTFEGQPREGETGNVDVCNILMALLNQRGANWSQCVDVSNCRQDDVDCEAYDGARVLRIQVTRSEYDQIYWRGLKNTGRATKDYLSKEDAADSMRDAVQQKSRKIANKAQRGQILLALDATEATAQILTAVIESFRERHGVWADSLGFAGIWVVGPYTDFTHRLDVLLKQT